MTSIFSRNFNIPIIDVNKYMRLRTSRMFSILHLVSTDHLNIAGTGTDVTLGKGLIWVLIKQRAEIKRMPKRDEEIVVKTWPTGGRHKLLHRHYSIETPEGETLINAGAVWSLIDIKTRSMIIPSDYDLMFDSVNTGNEISMRPNPKSIETTHHTEFTVPFSYIDSNRHMNSALCLDLVEDIIPAAKEGLSPKMINIRYQTEALEATVLNISWGHLSDETKSEIPHAGTYYMTCDSASGNHFKIQAEY